MASSAPPPAGCWCAGSAAPCRHLAGRRPVPAHASDRPRSRGDRPGPVIGWRRSPTRWPTWGHERPRRQGQMARAVDLHPPPRAVVPRSLAGGALATAAAAVPVSRCPSTSASSRPPASPVSPGRRRRCPTEGTTPAPGEAGAVDRRLGAAVALVEGSLTTGDDLPHRRRRGAGRHRRHRLHRPQRRDAGGAAGRDRGRPLRHHPSIHGSLALVASVSSVW